MKKLYILNNLNEDHFISNGLILESNRFEMNKGLFEKNGYEVKMLKEFISTDELNKLKQSVLNIKEYWKIVQNIVMDNFINHIKNDILIDEKVYIYFISHGWHQFFDHDFKNRNIYKILFCDDPHAFFLNKNKYGYEKVLSIDSSYKATGSCINTNYINPFLNRFDLILTTSISFFENIKYGKMDNIHYINYSINETFPLINNNNKKNEILLSGAIQICYPLRNLINNEIVKNNKDYSIFKKLNHPGYDNYDKNKIAGYKYLEKIREYKGAIADNLKFPLGYCVYKHIEILQSGTLGLYLYNDRLYKELGLEKNKHYIPVYIDENKPNEIKNLDEIKKIITLPISEKISKKGQQHVIENFNTCVNCQKFMNIINNNTTFYQCSLLTTLKLLKLGKSFVRLGDGDFMLLTGIVNGVHTQTHCTKELVDKYKKLLLTKNENIMIGIPPWFINYYDYHFDTPGKKENAHYTNFYEKNKDKIKPYLNLETIYHDAVIFRPFVKKYYSDIIYNTLQSIIQNKRVFLVCNHNTTLESPVIKSFFSNVKNLKIHHIDNIDAFSNNYEDLKKNINNSIQDIDIVLICGGAIRLLALELDSIQVIDLGNYFRIF